MTFGERLVESLKQRNLTQKELAEMIGVTPTRLNYWIKDKRQPDVEYIKKLASALKVSGDYLVGNMEELSRKAKEIDQFLLKYEQLDEHGRRLVNTVLEIEHERCVTQSTTNN